MREFSEIGQAQKVHEVLWSYCSLHLLCSVSVLRVLNFLPTFSSFQGALKVRSRVLQYSLVPQDVPLRWDVELISLNMETIENHSAAACGCGSWSVRSYS